MDWVKEFFDTAGSWWGRPEVRASDRERMERMRRLGGPTTGRILELGAGGGTTALVMAQAGYDVTAVELSTTRAQHMRDRAAEAAVDNLTVIEGDFYTLDLGGDYDCVTYWNGFGVGTDEDQRRLLRRTPEWLTPGAPLILDVMSPFRWIAITGKEFHGDDVAGYVSACDFDPITNRYSDAWWPEGQETDRVEQSGRCYTPADFQLLLETTGLTATSWEVDGQAFAPDEHATSSHPLWTCWEYTVSCNVSD